MENLQHQEANGSDSEAVIGKDLRLFLLMNTARQYRVLRDSVISETPERREPGWIANEVVRKLLDGIAFSEPVVREIQNFLHQPEDPTLAEISAGDSPLMGAVVGPIDRLLVARVSDLLSKEESLALDFLVLLQLELMVLPREVVDDFGHLRLDDLRKQIDTVPMALKLLERAPIYERSLKALERLGGACRERLVADYEPLVCSIARRHSRLLDLRTDGRMSPDDLCQVGLIGLLRAIDSFDIRRGFRLATYARPAIENEINDFIRRSLHPVAMPREVTRERIRISHLESKLRQDLGRNEVDRELCDVMGMPWERFQSIRYAFQPARSLDEPLVEETDITLADTIVDPSADTEETVCTAMTCQKLHEALQTLPDRDRYVLELRFGLRGNREFTFDELGRELGITRQAVYKTVGRALEKLRNPNLGLVGEEASAWE